MVDLNKHIYGDGFGPGGLDSWLSVTEGLTLVAPFVKTNKVYSVAGGNMEALTTETVDADGTKRSWGGIIAQAVANTARWQPGRGVLVEGAGTNVAIRTEDLATNWTNVNTTDDVNVTSAPDGTMTADKLIEDSDVGQVHYIYNAHGHAYDGASAYTDAYFVKAAERTWCHIVFPGDKFVGSPACSFDVGNGILGTETNCTGRMDQYPNGWWRCSITATSDAAGANDAGGRIYIAEADADVTYNGDGTSGIYVWGHQLEVGPFMSSYIPVGAASVARAADDLDIDNTGGLHVPAAAGTILAAVRPRYDAVILTAQAAVYDTRVAGGADGIYLYGEPSVDRWRVIIRSGGVNAGVLTSTVLAPVSGESQILALTWELNNFRLYGNGLLEDSDGAGNAPAAINANIYLGQTATNIFPAFADIGCIICYDRVLSALEVQSVTKDIAREMGVLL